VAATLFGPIAAHFRDLMDAAPVAAFVKDSDGRYIYANPYMLANTGKRMGSDWHGKTDADIWPPEVAAQICANDKAALRKGGMQVFSDVMPLEDGSHTFMAMKFPLPISGRSTGLGGIGIDLTEYSKTEAERNRLTAAIEQVVESVMITDREARITYVNPAFERVTGYTRDEVIGQNPRILQSGLQPSSSYQAMWAALTSGVPWVADLINRRKDGTVYTEAVVISPIRDASGAITSYVAVQRDLTHERALVQHSNDLIRQRTLIAETIRGLRAGDTPEATAQAICRQIVTFAGVAAASLLLFGLDGHAWPIGFGVEGRSDPPLRRVPLQRSRHLRERATEGPWIEPWVNQPGHPYNQLFKDLGIHSIACAPVRHNGRLIGLLVADAKGSVEDVTVAEALPALVEFADLAGALIGRDVAERTEVGRGRDHVSGIIAHRAFGPVFQPIIDLRRDEIVGYEALTRFNDGADPELMFAQAAAVGLGPELEIATLGAALAAARALPNSAWLNLNASPELILAGEPLRTILAGRRRRLVLEVTEHAAITDYPAFRASMAALGPKVELAVDDAGAGFASLRHIVELRPAFVKLDRWLVADLESDETRQSMIVGLCHFARATGCRLIAEGIETDSELAVLRALTIELGQGYLLGRPLPIDDIHRPGPVRIGSATPAELMERSQSLD
jgi:PAS domain S-box-containing protein